MKQTRRIVISDQEYIARTTCASHTIAFHAPDDRCIRHESQFCGKSLQAFFFFPFVPYTVMNFIRRVRKYNIHPFEITAITYRSSLSLYRLKVNFLSVEGE